MKRLTSFLSLFSSLSTLVCCALPALFVLLGAGAAFAGLVTNFPHLIWISEHKIAFFVIGGTMLSIAGWFQWNTRNQACPIEPGLGEACATTKDWSLWLYFASLGLYFLGLGFAYLPQLLN